MTLCPYVHLSVCPCLSVSVYLPDCLSICLSVCLSICLSVHPSACPSFCLSVCMCVHVCVSVRPSVCLSFCLPVCLSVSVGLSGRIRVPTITADEYFCCLISLHAFIFPDVICTGIKMPGPMEAVVVNCTEELKTPPVPPRRFNMDFTPPRPLETQSTISTPPAVPPSPNSASFYQPIRESPHLYSPISDQDPFQSMRHKDTIISPSTDHGLFHPIMGQDTMSSPINSLGFSPVVPPVVDLTTHPGLLANFRVAMETKDPRRTPISSPVYEEIDFDPLRSRSSTPSTGSSTITAEHDGKQSTGTGNTPTRNVSVNVPLLSPVDGAVRAGSLSARDYLELGKKREIIGGINSSEIDRRDEDFNRGIEDGEIFHCSVETITDTGKLWLMFSVILAHLALSPKDQCRCRLWIISVRSIETYNFFRFKLTVLFWLTWHLGKWINRMMYPSTIQSVG